MKPIILTFLAEYLRNGQNGRKAALAANPSLALSSADTMAQRWLQMPECKAWLESVRKSAQNRAVETELLSLQEKRQFLARVVRADLKGDIPGDLLQSIKLSGNEEKGEVLEYKVPDKLKALDLDAKLAGDYGEGSEPEGSDFDLMLDRLSGIIIDAEEVESEPLALPTTAEPEDYSSLFD